MNRSSELIAFNKLFADYHKRFIRFAFSYVKDNTVAEDFTMEAFMAYWEIRDSLPSSSNVPAYILTSLKNKCLNYLQHMQTRQDVEEKLAGLAVRELNARIATLQACDPNDFFSVEMREIIRKAIQQLPPKTRMIFRMSRMEQLPHAEISRQTGLSVKSVEFHITKALKVLRISLREYLSCFFTLSL